MLFPGEASRNVVLDLPQSMFPLAHHSVDGGQGDDQGDGETAEKRQFDVQADGCHAIYHRVVLNALYYKV